MAARWQEWTTRQRLTGPDAVADFANPAQMNHFTWYQTHGWQLPYPGENQVYAPEQVPGAFLPSAESDGCPATGRLRAGPPGRRCIDHRRSLADKVLFTRTCGLNSPKDVTHSPGFTEWITVSGF